MTVKTPEQVKADFHAKGITFADLAREQGWRVQDVYKVLNGQVKSRYGKVHEIAVYLGLKPNPEHMD